MLTDKIAIKNTFFEKPTQVAFIDDCTLDETDDPHLLGGIAFQDFIICGECGSAIPLEDVAMLKILPWCDVSEAIGGDELFLDEDK